MVPINETQLPELKPNLPSIAEALAVLAGCTLVMSSADAPFVHFYNYSNKIFTPPLTQYFNASLRYKDYATGSNHDWQDMFYVILFLVFAINVFSLIYLIKQVCWDGQVTDYTVPENLFAIANLSPPSHILQGACGGGPREGILGKKWRVDMKNTDDTESMTHGMRRHPHFYFKCVEDDGGSPEVSGKERKRRSRPKSIGQWHMREQGESPAIEQYRRLTGYDD
ncbi:hypothetical protein GJ744_009537 [Endocarpon pusillum]|uniref:Uncharacterized protein n=1 Tax=Endocarpon pusillum TaxID=364733 RepID=A0A8H7AJ81_9EURO|nr:hypothetical protein GJ744_009537 [Endocarpon pusillum]